MRNTKRNIKKYHGHLWEFKLSKIIGNLAKIAIFLIGAMIFMPLCPWVLVGVIVYYIIYRKDFKD